ncbi:MAG TPA: hypothetical protein VKF37_04175, partial [Chloroflexota bacterium]|nr:hypothetical protein [Chloroflexota bacterium]
MGADETAFPHREWTYNFRSAILVPALVAGMLAPAMSQVRGHSPLVVARPPTAHSAVRALAPAAAT